MEFKKTKTKLSKIHTRLLNAMPVGQRAIYDMALCGVCHEKIDKYEIEWCIDQKFIPVCKGHRAEAQERVKKLWGYMDQMSLL